MTRKIESDESQEHELKDEKVTLRNFLSVTEGE